MLRHAVAGRIGLGIALVAWGCASTAPVAGRPGVVPRTDGRAVTLPAAAASSLLREGERAFVPSHAEVLAVESRLAAALDDVIRDPRRILTTDSDAEAEAWLAARANEVRQRLPEYLRQYLGIEERSGARRIFANFLEMDFDLEGLDWTSELILVDDGGVGFWQAEFGLPGLELQRIAIHGEG